MRLGSLAAAAGLALLAAGALGGVAAQSLPPATVSYTIYESSGTAEVSRYGSALPEMTCSGAWEDVFSGLHSAPLGPEKVLYRFSYERGEFQVRHTDDGTTTFRVYACDGNVTVGPPTPADDTPRNRWQEHDAGGCAGEDADASALAPLDPSFDRSFEVPSNLTRVCVEAKGADGAARDHVPFTGQVEAELVDPATGNSIRVWSCTMVVGSCWDVATGSSGAIRPVHGSELVLQCSVDGLYGLDHVAAGTYGCAATAR